MFYALMKSGLADRTLPLFIRIIQLCRSFIPTPCTLKTKRERERAGAYRNPPMASVHKFRGFLHKFAYQKLTRKNEKNTVGIRERSNASGCIFMRYEPNQRSNVSKDVVRFKVTENRLIRSLWEKYPRADKGKRILGTITRVGQCWIMKVIYRRLFRALVWRRV